jgi:hypothetical protein
MTTSLPHIRFIVAGKVSRNYTILPSGEVQEDVIGGSALYGAAGAGVWESGIGVIARASCDYPQEWLERISKKGVDSRGIHKLSDQIDQRAFAAYPDPETKRTDNPVALFAQMGLNFPKSLLGLSQSPMALDSRSRPTSLTIRQSDIPSDYLDAIAAHICPLDYLSHTLLPPTLRQGHIHTITLDPGEGYMDPTFLDDMPVILSGLTAFLCNEEKLVHLFMGRASDPWEMAEAIASMGCGLVVIKRGAAGQYLYDRESNAKWIIPAYPARVRSLEGAGDAFCGGFLTGYRATYDPLQATLRGNIGASFVIEGSDPFFALEAMPGLAAARLESIKDKVRRA